MTTDPEAPQPASEVTADLGAAKPASGAELVTSDSGADCAPAPTIASATRPESQPGRSPSASACEAYREAIEVGLSRGRNAKAIWQDLVDGCGFAGAYQSVRSFVRKLRGKKSPEPSARDRSTNSSEGAPILGIPAAFVRCRFYQLDCRERRPLARAGKHSRNFAPPSRTVRRFGVPLALEVPILPKPGMQEWASLNDLPNLKPGDAKPRYCGGGQSRQNGRRLLLRDWYWPGTMEEFAGQAFYAYVDRPVVDRTGLTERYDVHLEFARGEFGTHALPGRFT